MQPTPLRVRKIVAFLKPRIGLVVVPIYQGGAADGQGVGLTNFRSASLLVLFFCLLVCIIRTVNDNNFL